MGLWQRLLDYLGFGPEEDEYDEDDLMEEKEESVLALREPKRPTDVPVERQRKPTVSAELRSDRTAPSPAWGKVISVTGKMPMRMVAMHVKAFEDCQDAANQLIQGHPVIVNLEGLDKETTTRILYFLHGVVYTLNGSVLRINTHLFVFAPQGIDIDTLGHGWDGKAGKGSRPEKITPTTLFKPIAE